MGMTDAGSQVMCSFLVGSWSSIIWTLYVCGSTIKKKIVYTSIKSAANIEKKNTTMQYLLIIYKTIEIVCAFWLVKNLWLMVPVKLIVLRGGHRDFRFCGFGYFFRSVFRFLLQKTSVFRFWWSLRFADFSFFSIWFSVFVKNTSGFSVLVPDVVFGFSYFGFRFLFDLSST